MSKVTEKNTKKEIMAYVEELETKLAEKHEARKTTEDVKKETKVKEIKESAAKLIATGIVNEKTEAQYNNLLETIKLLDKELEEVYEIQRTANTLEALLITYEDKNESLKKEHAEKVAKAKEEFETKAAAWDELLKQCRIDHDKLVSDLRDQFREEKQKLEKERAREREEYTYNLLRERNIENDEWADEKAQREAVISNREFELTKRENAAAELEERVKVALDEIEILKQEKLEQYNKGFEEGKTKAAKDNAIVKSYMEKDYKTQLERKDDKIVALEESLDETRKSNITLQSKLDAAYTRIQEMAIESAKNSGTRIVESATK